MNPPGIKHPFAGRQIRRRGASSGDETFTLAQTGMFNVSKIWRFYDRRAELFDHVEVNIDDNVRRIIRDCRDIDPHRVASMSTEDADHPHNVALAVIVNGAWEPIDGNHLIAKRIAMQRPTFRAVVMPARLIPQFLIHWEVRENKRWRRISPEEILSALEGTYPQPDGRILDAAGSLLDRVPPSKKPGAMTTPGEAGYRGG